MNPAHAQTRNQNYTAEPVCEPNAPTPFENESKGLHENIELLTDAVNRLQARVSIASRPSPVCTQVNVKDAPRPVYSGVVSCIAEASSKVRGQLDRVNQMISELEI